MGCAREGSFVVGGGPKRDSSSCEGLERDSSSWQGIQRGAGEGDIFYYFVVFN